jgi:hypothetical protein
MSSIHADAALTERGPAGMFLQHSQLTYKMYGPAPFASNFAIWSGQSAATYPVSGP